MLKQVAYEIGNAVAPALRQAAMWIMATTKVAIEFVRTHKEMLVTVLKIGVALIALGATLLLMGKTLAIVSTALGIARVAMQAFAKAEAVAEAMSGPTGLALVAAGALAAAGAVYALNKIFNESEHAMGDLGKAISDVKKEYDKLSTSTAKFNDERKKEVKQAAGDTAEAMRLRIALVLQGGWRPPMAQQRDFLTQQTMAMGLFNTGTMRSMAAGYTGADRVAKATEETAKHTKDIADIMSGMDELAFE
jgi:hypothetical protein